jgi:Cu(I)/Ag(I) efflux system membrane fusion protein
MTVSEQLPPSPLDARSPDQQRSRRRPVNAFVAGMVGALVGGTGVWAWTSHRHDTTTTTASPLPTATTLAKAKTLYQCPMHPSITSDHPGDCPICGMKLVPVAQPSGDAERTGPPGPRRPAFYRSPMDPKQTSPTPRKDEMGMDYVPVYTDELSSGGQHAPVTGLATVTIDPARQQMIGLKTVPVAKGPIADSWRTVGRVEVDPTRVRRINIKIDGYVERAFVAFVGQPVHKGQPLFSVYSPSLLVAQNEYLLALQTRKQLAGAGTLASNGDDLVKAARRKLELWDVPEKEIERLERTGEPAKTLTLVSPISGVVTTKNLVEGARLNPGDTPYEITDLSTVWVMADAYQADLARVRVGMSATMTVSAFTGRLFKGRVKFIDPVLDPKTRTTKVHLHFPNATGELRPDMYGEVQLEGKATSGLLVPADAIIHAGTKDIVFVALGNGKFAPREVRLGVVGASETQVLEGLREGEDVVTRANFLIDSESRLRASLASITAK